MRWILLLCVAAMAVATSLCPVAAALPLPGTAAVDVSVSPTLLQAELGSFLWIAETDVGSVTVRNLGRSTVAVTTQLSDAVHDIWGAVAATGSQGVAAVLTAEPGAMVLAPGAAGTVHIRADSSVAREKKSGAAAVLRITAQPPAGGADAAAKRAAASAATAARIDVTVLVKPAGAKRGHGASAWLQVEGISAGSDGVWMDVHNAGPFYAWTSGTVEVKQGASRASVRVPQSLIFPGCTRRLELIGLAEMNLAQGRHEVVVKLAGEEATTSVLNLTTSASPVRH